MPSTHFYPFNSVGTGTFEEDVKMLLNYVPQGIVLSKCRSASDVARLADALNDVGPSGQCSICALVELPEGLMNAGSIAGKSPRFQLWHLEGKISQPRWASSARPMRSNCSTPARHW